MEAKKGIYIGANTNLIKEIEIEISEAKVNEYIDIDDFFAEAEDNIDFIIAETQSLSDTPTEFWNKLQENEYTKNSIVILLSHFSNAEQNFAYFKMGFDDVYTFPINAKVLATRISFLSLIKTQAQAKQEKAMLTYKLPLIKRAFDILLAGGALIALSPLFIIVAILIRLESKGKVFYASKRVGTGYKIFDFYKFRSMYMNADARIAELKKDNQYAKSKQNTTEEQAATNTATTEHITSDEPLLFSDTGSVNENEYLQKITDESETAFVKIKDDPRITKVGRFIRNTSIDELPQLINVLKGDMSIVGNRPLPLYEAEQLTTNKWVERFIAPAGLTGLWQVEKRAKNTEMSPEERKMLDNKYAKNFSFSNDIKLILRTFPALLQKENV